jgi:hypothetical protein
MALEPYTIDACRAYLAGKCSNFGYRHQRHTPENESRGGMLMVSGRSQ